MTYTHAIFSRIVISLICELGLSKYLSILTMIQSIYFDSSSAECNNVLSPFLELFKCHIPLESESIVLSPQQLRCCISGLCGHL